MFKIKKLFIFIYILLLVATVVFAVVIDSKSPKFIPPDESKNFDYEFIHGEIVQFVEGDDSEEIQKVVLKANSGEEEGKSLTVLLTKATNYNSYKKGDEVLVYKDIDKKSGNITYEIADYYHQRGLFYLFLIFAAITIFVAKKKGLTAIISVLGSLVLFYFVFLKMVSVGYSPLLACLIFVFIVTILSIPLIHGINKKSLAAIISIFIGYLASIGITFWFAKVSGLGAASGEEFRSLIVMYPKVDLWEILIASLFMGVVGALIDTAISIASAVFEALKDTGAHSFKRVYKIGMEVGKDVLASMTNTLLFAYLASALPFFVIITFLSEGRNSAVSELLNMDFIALELTRTFIGAISLVLVIPIVATMSAYLLTKFSGRKA